MKLETVGFIGGGRVTRIILDGWKRAGIGVASVAVSDANAETLKRLKARYPEIAIVDNRAVAERSLIFLAVHPPAMATVLEEVRSFVPEEALVVSLAPKITLAKLAEGLGGHHLLARVIPNAPSIIGAGYNPVAFAAGMPEDVKRGLVEWLSPLGDLPEVAEAKLEGFALLSGMGPTYIWFQLQVLRELATGFGLTEADVTPALKKMVCGATRTLIEAGLSPADVMDLVPVRPLADDEATIAGAYRTRLPAVFAKIKP